MKKLLLTTGIMLSLNVQAQQDWSWYPAATSQMAGFTQTKELADKSEVTRSVAVAISAWVDSGGRYECTDWSPDASEMPGGAAFSQTRSCEKHSFREFKYTADGSQLHFRLEWKRESINDDRMSDGGELDYVTHSTTSTTGWVPDGSASTCTDWTPARSDIGNGKPFTQNRSCTSAEKNTTVIYDHWASGSITVQSENVQTRSSDYEEPNSTTGTGGDGDMRYVRTDYGPWTQDNGTGSLSCGSFSYPEDKTTDFIVTRSCTEPEIRKVYDIYRSYDYNEDPYDCPQCSGIGQEKRVEQDPETRTHTVTDSLNVDVVVRPWVNDGAEYACSEWSPTMPGRTSTYTQTKSCKQNQKRRRYYQIVLSNASQEDCNDNPRYCNEPAITEIVYDTTDTQVTQPSQRRTVYVDSTSKTKYEYSNMSSTQAKAACYSSGKVVDTATGGVYRQLFTSGLYEYFANFIYEPELGISRYMGKYTEWQSNWAYSSKVISTAPTCTYKPTEPDLGCGGRWEPECK